jgi:ElaB/YqjD/DUF883 family membrane-anchored ribosome-binding protein
MNNETQALRDDLMALAKDAQALMTATTEVVGHSADQARKRLSAALTQATETCTNIRQSVLKSGNAVDESLHRNPYQTVAVALGAGLVLGLLLGRKPGASAAECSL